MQPRYKALLVVDGVANIVLGIVLLLFPFGIAGLLGLPDTITDFYPSILGAVLLGIGIALFIERYGASRNIRGLGLGGALAINICGAGALLVWLLVNSLQIPMRGYVILWSVALTVLIIGLNEIAGKTWRYEE
jgi:hypothetical protein